MSLDDSARLRARLRAEARRPWRVLRLLVYLACAASGFIGLFINVFRVLAGRDLPQSLTNVGVQVAVLAIAVGLWRFESRNQERLEAQMLRQESERR